MTKKHKQRAVHTPRQTLPRRALVALQDAIWLTERREYDTAREKLDALDKQFPHQPEILFALLDVLYEQKDAPHYLVVCEQLVGFEPDNPDLLLNLAGSYSSNVYPVSALTTFRQFLGKFPQHERAADVHDSITELERLLPDILRDAGLTEPHAEQAAMLHERSLALMAVGELKRARRVVDELLALKPDFIPALNNSSNLAFAEGDLARASEIARRVLEREPENIQAVSNLTRFLCLQGRLEEAQQLAVTLKTIDSERADAETKQVEALAMLGDDAGILEVYERASKRGHLEEPFVTPLFLHIVGAAALRQGDEKRAKKLWERALQLAPFEITRANLDDLKEPVGERHAPWFFTLREWVPEKTIRELVARITPATKRGNAVIRQATERFFRDHPEVRGLIPLLLDRGDPMGREFALHLASGFDAPDMKSALRDFALGTRGPDAMRLHAAEYAMRAGLIPSGNITFYTKGEWQDVLLLNMELTGEPSLHLRAPVQELYEESHQAMLDDEPERAETLLRQAAALEPDDPAVQHNLAMSLELQGRYEQAEALLRENHARHPEYLFSRCVLARLEIKHKHYAAARDLLEPLMLQKRFHYSEFAAYAGAQIDLLLAEGQREGAKMWFDLWSSVDPDNPQLNYFRAQFSPLGRFLRR